MKKKIVSMVGIAAFLLITGCSKQPNLENAAETNQTAQTQSMQSTANNQTSSTSGGATVNTENATVQTENLSEQNSTNTATKQQFAKKLANIVVYFNFDKYNIRSDQWPKVEKLAKLIKSNPANYTVRIEGNCDEWGTEEYNYALGLKRANTVKNALIKLGVDPKKLTVISYGELNPVCTAHAKWCWRLNRRDNFTYLP